MHRILRAGIVLAATLGPIASPALATAEAPTAHPPTARAVAETGSGEPIETGSGSNCNRLPCSPPQVNLWNEIFEVFYSILVTTGSANWGDLRGQDTDPEPSFPGSGSSGSAG
ncbi:hypothetical protein [Nocardia shimofusensis]|uniref:hypothetical protein n=1 Tax=Nocardia shimofusensis TaxID=228596 RepID=UPI0008323E30|nr:hypothetical protein [Nocardia shimofusensis]